MHGFAYFSGSKDVTLPKASKYRVKLVKSDDGIFIRASVKGNGFCGVRMNEAMSEYSNYFEVMLKEPADDGVIGIGLGPSKYRMSVMPGWKDGSIGYHSDDGGLYCQKARAEIHSATYKKGDVMGCGIDCTTAGDGYVSVWFTKNDRLVMYPQNLDVPQSSKLYPMIGMSTSGHYIEYLGPSKKIPPDRDASKFISIIITG